MKVGAPLASNHVASADVNMKRFVTAAPGGVDASGLVANVAKDTRAHVGVASGHVALLAAKC